MTGTRATHGTFSERPAEWAAAEQRAMALVTAPTVAAGRTARWLKMTRPCGEGGGRMRGMVDLAIQCFNLDTTDPARIASFWEEALGWRRTHVTLNEVVLEPPAGSAQDGVAPDLLFLRVPEDKTVKNRWHLDLRPEDQGIEVARLEALGAMRVDVGQGDNIDWVVMADPDGNEFCVLRAFSQEERQEITREAAAHAAGTS